VAYVRRTVQRRSGRRVGLLRWTIGAALAAGLTLASLVWNTDGGKIDKARGSGQSVPPPKVAHDAPIVFSVPDLAFRDDGTADIELLGRVEPSVGATRPKRDASESPATRAPAAALAQFGDRLPPGGGNRPGGGGPGNGNQVPGGGNQFGAGGGAGGVCIATKIQLEPNATAVLTDRRDTVVLARPIRGSFFSD